MGYLLLENSDKILLEGGSDKLLMEDGAPATPDLPPLAITVIQPSKQRFRDVQIRTGRPIPTVAWAVITAPVSGVQPVVSPTPFVRVITGNPPGNAPVVVGQDFLPRTQVVLPIAPVVQPAQVRLGLTPGNVVFFPTVPVLRPTLPIAPVVQPVTMRLGLTPGNVVVIVTVGSGGEVFLWNHQIGVVQAWNHRQGELYG